MTFHTWSLTALSEGLRTKQFTSVQLTEYFLDRIERLDGHYNSIITITREAALEEAAQADRLIEQGQAGPLCGIPIIHKDIFCRDGQLTTCASKMLGNFVAPYESTVTLTLKEAGMVGLGKANMDEFAMGSTNTSSAFGAVYNPWDTTRVPGGSSGGSAAAVAAGLAPIATGSDTGGSIRQPAAFCGLTGIKPTYGSVSRYGMIAFASSLDQAGPIGRSAEDCALILEAMIGLDEKDSTSVAHPKPKVSEHLGRSLSGLKIGVPVEFFADELSPTVNTLTREALAQLETLGAELVEVSLPRTQESIATYYVIAPSEASANLSRFDGVRYGYRCESPKNLDDLYTRSRTEGFGEEVKRRILVGTYCLSAGYYDAYFKKAQQVRRLIKEDFDNVLNSVDIIIGPTTPTTAFSLDADKTPAEMYLEDIYTLSVNLAGLPGMSIPCGFSEGLPVGLQLIGKAFDESTLLNVAHQYQQVTNYHQEIAPGVDA